MKIMVITWEFPPYIAGGLGMACYGLVKAMLEAGVEVDLVLPSTEDVYFPLRHPDDADTLPMAHIDEKKGPEMVIYEKSFLKKNVRERLAAVGITSYPETYTTPGFNFEKFLEFYYSLSTMTHSEALRIIQSHLKGSENLFRKVQEFTALVVKCSRVLNFDVIHAHDWLTYTAGLMAKRLTNKPLVSHIHATEFDRAGGAGDERIHNIEYAGLSHSDRVAAVSQYTAQMIIDRYRIDPNKIRVVYNAHSVPADDLRKKRKLFKDPVVLFLGRITIQKGPDYFLRIADNVIKRFPKVRFIMAGSGDMFKKIMKGAAAKRLKDRFLFSGFLDREQVEQILTSTDIFILPSVSEPFGIAPLEAMAFGAVAVVSKQSGVAEVVENAFKVDFWDVDKTADIIVDLLKNPEKRKKIAKAGQKEVITIGWKEAAEKMIQIYKELTCST